MCTFISILAAVNIYLHWDIPVCSYTTFPTNDSWISKDRIIWVKTEWIARPRKWWFNPAGGQSLVGFLREHIRTSSV